MAEPALTEPATRTSAVCAGGARDASLSIGEGRGSVLAPDSKGEISREAAQGGRGRK